MDRTNSAPGNGIPARTIILRFLQPWAKLQHILVSAVSLASGFRKPNAPAIRFLLLGPKSKPIPWNIQGTQVYLL